MLETTKDWFYLVLSVCVLGVSVFLCYALYNFSQAARQVNYFLNLIRTKIESATSLAAKIKSLIFSQVAKGFSSVVSNLSANKKTKSKNK